MKGNILIAYYSWSGNIRKIAGQIQHATEGVLYEIRPQIPYSQQYDDVVEQAKQEIRDGHRPALQEGPDGMDMFDTIFIGSPNWWSSPAPPVVSFLAGHNFSGKIMIPFCSHGGGGKASVLRDIADLCTGAIVKEGIAVYGDQMSWQDLSTWLERING